MGSCWSDASNDVAADKSVSAKDAITEADVKVVSVGRFENIGGQPSKNGDTSRLPPKIFRPSYGNDFDIGFGDSVLSRY